MTYFTCEVECQRPGCGITMDELCDEKEIESGFCDGFECICAYDIGKIISVGEKQEW